MKENVVMMARSSVLRRKWGFAPLCEAAATFSGSSKGPSRLLGDSLSCPLENKLSDVHEILLRLFELPSCLLKIAFRRKIAFKHPFSA